LDLSSDLQGFYILVAMVYLGATMLLFDLIL